MSRYACLCILLMMLMLENVAAFDISPGSVITDRPSSERLPMPGFTPKKPPPGLTLPPAPPLKPIPEQPGETKLVVKEFRFSGNTVFTSQELQTIAKPFLGRAIGVSDLEQLRHLLTQHYINQGYINSGALLPKQVFKDGIINFQIIEGELSEIRVSGTGWLRPDYVRDRLELGTGPPLNYLTLQDRYQLLLTDPLIERMDGRLMPGLVPGQSILDVNVIRAKPYGLSLSADNYRPPSTGAYEGRVDGWLRNITGFGDLLNLSLGFGEDRLDIDTGITMPISRYDTLLGFYYSNRRSSVLEQPLNDLDIENKFRSYEITLFQPVYRTLQQRINLGIRVAARKSSNTLLGRPFSFSLGEDNGVSKVTALRLSQEFIDSRANQVFFIRSTFSVGLNLFDATWHSDNRPDGDYLAWLGQFQYTRLILNTGAQFRFRGNVQVANDRLLPLEQYAVGGVYSVRGYRENELVRDQGYNFSVEFQYPLFSGAVAAMIPGELAIVPFFDYGAAWNKDDSDNIEHLYGIGAGLLWSHPRFSTELFYAHGLNKRTDRLENDLQDVSLYFRVTAFLF